MKTIETAPKDGTHVLLYGDHEDDTGERNIGWCEGYWEEFHEWYHITSLPCYPTHWMDLPKVPGDKQ